MSDFFINGPVALYRLENNNKIIYLFGDIHFNDTECLNLNSIDIHKYLIKSLNLKKSLDFFIEKPQYGDERFLLNKRNQNYLIKVRGISDLFNKKLNPKIQSLDNKRFHYFDDDR